MSFFAGLKDFLTAFRFLSTKGGGRSWFVSSLWKAVFIGVALSLLFVFLLGGALAAGFYQVSELLPYAWLDVVSGTLLGILFVVALYFGLGPIILLLSSLILSQWGDWRGLQKIQKLQIRSFDDQLDLGDLIVSVLRALVLGVLIVFSAVIGLFPPLLAVTWLLSAYAIGKEWVWTGDELYSREHRTKTSVLYCIGMGAIPAALAGIPIFGLVSIPILQASSLFRYRSL